MVLAILAFRAHAYEVLLLPFSLSLSAPGDDTSSPTTALTIPSDLSSPSAFTDVLAQVSNKDENAYSSSKLPPTPPFKRPHHILKIQKGAVPHDPHAYYPAENYA